MDYWILRFLDMMKVLSFLFHWIQVVSYDLKQAILTTGIQEYKMFLAFFRALEKDARILFIQIIWNTM